MTILPEPAPRVRRCSISIPTGYRQSGALKCDLVSALRLVIDDELARATSGSGADLAPPAFFTRAAQGTKLIAGWDAQRAFSTARDIARRRGAVIFERRAEASLLKITGET